MRALNITIVTPAAPGSLHGNRITALRWARILRALGQRVTIRQSWEPAAAPRRSSAPRRAAERCELLIALHARRSFGSILRFRRAHPDRPLIVALTGTDLYGGLARGGRALASASRIIVLQPRALDALPPEFRRKARVIYQSVAARSLPSRSGAAPPAMFPSVASVSAAQRSSDARPVASPSAALRRDARERAIHLGLTRLGSSVAARTVTGSAARAQATASARGVSEGLGSGSHAGGIFQVCVLGHLRPVKDPFRTAMAARLLPSSSRIQVLHLGAALNQAMARRARAQTARNPRYRWMGARPRPEALRLLARSRLLVLSSRMEGGANAVSEAVALSVPVLSARIAGSIGLLGARYPGYFPVGDTRALGRLLERAETDPAFLARLRRWGARLAPRFDPERETRSWKALLREL